MVHLTEQQIVHLIADLRKKLLDILLPAGLQPLPLNNVEQANLAKKKNPNIFIKISQSIFT